MLGRGRLLLSLSEPFLTHAVAPDWKLHRFFRTFQRTAGLKRCPPPRGADAEGFWRYLVRMATDNGFCGVAIKETFRSRPPHPSWHNVEQLDWLRARAKGVAALIRDPFDTVASTLRLCWWVLGLRGRLVAWRWPTIPIFACADEVVHWAATNWASYAAWVRQRELKVIRYEDFVRDPADWLPEICRRMGIPFEAPMLAHELRPRAFWGIGDPQVMRRPARRVHGQAIGRAGALTAAQRGVVRSACARCAEDFGYAV